MNRSGKNTFSGLENTNNDQCVPPDCVVCSKPMVMIVVYVHVICMTDNIADKVNRYEYVEGVGPLHQYDFSKAPTTISLI